MHPAYTSMTTHRPSDPKPPRIPYARLIAFAIGLLVLPASTQAESSTPRLGLPTFEVKADDQFRWGIPIKLVNTTSGGIYSDSLRIEVEDLDPGLSRRPRRFEMVDTTIARFLPSISAGDSGIFRYGGSAFSETARLRLRLFSHGGNGVRYESTGELTVGPGMMSDHLASRFLMSGKDSIEYIFVPETWPPKASPSLLVIPGWDSHARLLLPAAWHLANHGYSVMVMSLPGYGLSSGPADLGGPRSLAAVERALDLLRRSENVDSTRIAVWGIGQGATTALQLAARHPELKAVLAQAGFYDLEALASTTTSEDIRRLITDEAGPRGGWKRRSVVSLARRIKVPVALVHGENDTATPLSLAGDYVNLLKENGVKASLRFIPHQGHRLNPITARDTADQFFEEYLTPNRRSRQ